MQIFEIVGGVLLGGLGIVESALLVRVHRRSSAGRALAEVPPPTRRRWLRSIARRDGGEVPTSFLVAVAQRPVESWHFRVRAVVASWLVCGGIAIVAYGTIHSAEFSVLFVSTSAATTLGSVIGPRERPSRMAARARALLEQRRRGLAP